MQTTDDMKPGLIALLLAVMILAFALGIGAAIAWKYLPSKTSERSEA